MEAVSASLVTIHRFSVLRTPQTRTHFDPNYKPITRRKQRYTVIRCCKKRVWEGARKERDYYQLLGVSVNSSSQQIKQAYRKLQKKHHPDIAGHQGHEYTLLLNEAYQVLMKDNLRKEYDASIGKVRVGFGRNTSDLGYSTWKGPLRPQALFVDENACIGCRECVHHSSNTFIMDEVTGCARVKVQYGDDEKKIEVSVDSCPVNCIHWVDAEDLPVLEFLIQPQPKEGHGLFGGGWDRPANVFMAAKTFTKQQKKKTGQHDRNAKSTVQEEETPAQAAARANAARELEMERFSRIWNWFKKISGSDQME